jgi:hypothetical protein
MAINLDPEMEAAKIEKPLAKSNTKIQSQAMLCNRIVTLYFFGFCGFF